MSVKDALEKYSKRFANVKKKKTKNKAPEKEVEKEVTTWLKSCGFDMSVIESKAVYSRGAGRYLRGQTEAGFSDLAGVTPHGVGCFIELKSVGKKSNVSSAQYDFLVRKIGLGAFACCVDSVSYLAEVYRIWSMLIKQNPEEAKTYLIDLLPDKHKDNDFAI